MQDLREPQLDPIDTTLIGELARDARATNAQLAARAGVAPSTAHARLRALEGRGIVRGYHASIDQAALGRGLQAMIGVTLRAGLAAGEHRAVRRRRSGALPQVIQLFFVGGVDDFLVHVAVEDSSELRAVVVQHLSAQHSVASTRTSVIFAYQRNALAAPFD